MKKLSQILAAGVITMAPFVVSNSAFAVGTCEVGFTGPDSNNKCISETKFACTVVNVNEIAVTNENLQIAVSGNASGTENTTTGSSRTGSATNSNNTTFSATVTNTDICTVVATRPAIVTPGGGGAGAATPPVATIKAVPAPQGGKGAASALPNTSADSTLAYVVGLVGIFGAVAVMSRMAVMAYSRLKS